jgi:hypothetical protein
MQFHRIIPPKVSVSFAIGSVCALALAACGGSIGVSSTPVQNPYSGY